MRYLSTGVLLGFLLLSCGESVIHPEPDRGYEYFPLKVGASWTYQVDSIIFDDGGSINVLDTVSGFVNERITGRTTDLTGDTVYTLERRHRELITDPWTTTHIWTISRDDYRAVRNEENVRLVKMSFPLDTGSRWDPLRFVSPDTEVPVGTELIEMYTNWSGAVLAIGHPKTVGDLMFGDVMTCQQADDDNEIERRYVREQYARGIGLITRNDTILDSYCKRIGQIEPCFGLSWMEKGEKGYILQQQLIDFQQP
ncbi:MAG: hypothetical protein R3330_01940 [Saprospiraceae bacterium]|nr:hypothetical protein [Saprospiraceae bacterium]